MTRRYIFGPILYTLAFSLSFSMTGSFTGQSCNRVASQMSEMPEVLEFYKVTAIDYVLQTHEALYDHARTAGASRRWGGYSVVAFHIGQFVKGHPDCGSEKP